MANTDLIERATKAIDLFDAICGIHDPAVSAHDRRVMAMAKVLEAAPDPSPAPGVVDRVLDAAAEYMIEQYGIGAFHHKVDRQRIKAALASLSQPAKEREGGRDD